MTRSKEIKFGNEARIIVLEGIRKTAMAVGATLGASGRNVVIAQESGIPINTKDGVTVARHISLEDEGENQGCLMVKETAARAVADSGDGTTTASILLYKICSLIDKALSETPNANVTLIKRGMTAAVKNAVAKLSEIAVPISSKEDLIHIATVSANNDAFLGELIGSAYYEVGKEGEVAYEFSNSEKTETTVVEGMRIGKGLSHPGFVNQPSSLSFTAKGCHVFVSDKQISNWQEISPILEELVLNSNGEVPNIVFIAPIDHDAFAFILQNVNEGKINACIVHPPESSDLRKEICEDISAFCGGLFHAKDAGIKISGDLTRLGYVQSVVVNQTSTILTAGSGSAESRIEYLKTMLSADLSNSKKQEIEQRIARLSGKHALIKVGGQTQSSTLERVDRVDDAIHATKASMQEGYVAGCGSSYYQLSQLIYGMDRGDGSGESLIGYDIIREALKYPMIKNLENGGIVSPIKDFKYGNGYNMLVGDECNLIESGIIDPAKVVRVAIENAAAVGEMFLITECLITHTEKQDERNSSQRN